MPLMTLSFWTALKLSFLLLNCKLLENRSASYLSLCLYSPIFKVKDTRFTVVIILPYTQILNHYAVYLKLIIMLYVKYTTIKKRRKMLNKGWLYEHHFYFSEVSEGFNNIFKVLNCYVGLLSFGYYLECLCSEHFWISQITDFWWK